MNRTGEIKGGRRLQGTRADNVLQCWVSNLRLRPNVFLRSYINKRVISDCVYMNHTDDTYLSLAFSFEPKKFIL